MAPQATPKTWKNVWGLFSGWSWPYSSVPAGPVDPNAPRHWLETLAIEAAVLLGAIPVALTQVYGGLQSIANPAVVEAMTGVVNYMLAFVGLSVTARIVVGLATGAAWTMGFNNLGLFSSVPSNFIFGKPDAMSENKAGFWQTFLGGKWLLGIAIFSFVAVAYAAGIWGMLNSADLIIDALKSGPISNLMAAYIMSAFAANYWSSYSVNMDKVPGFFAKIGYALDQVPVIKHIGQALGAVVGFVAHYVNAVIDYIAASRLYLAIVPPVVKGLRDAKNWLKDSRLVRWATSDSQSYWWTLTKFGILLGATVLLSHGLSLGVWRESTAFFWNMETLGEFLGPLVNLLSEQTWSYFPYIITGCGVLGNAIFGYSFMKGALWPKPKDLDKPVEPVKPVDPGASATANERETFTRAMDNYASVQMPAYQKLLPLYEKQEAKKALDARPGHVKLKEFWAGASWAVRGLAVTGGAVAFFFALGFFNLSYGIMIENGYSIFQLRFTGVALATYFTALVAQPIASALTWIPHFSITEFVKEHWNWAAKEAVGAGQTLWNIGTHPMQWAKDTLPKDVKADWPVRGPNWEKEILPEPATTAPSA